MHDDVRTQILTVNPSHPEQDAIQKAADVILAGRLVAFPTETVYGLGANALDAEAINRIYIAKQRPATDPIIAHIHNVRWLDQLAVDIPDVAYTLAEHFWPGALTFVLQRAPRVPQNIATGLTTVAVRMPVHPVAHALLQVVQVPIGAPSANTFTRPSATTAAHVLEDLNGRVDVVLDGGATTIGLESTVLDLTKSQPVVLRPGGVTLEALQAVLPDVQLSPRYVTDAESTVSPGQMLKHYAPRAKVTVYTGAESDVIAAMQATARQYDSGKVGVLVPDEDCGAFEALAVVVPLGPRDDLGAMSKRLFAGFRDLDAFGVEVILTRDLGRAGLGAALWDRLLRAAEGRIIEV